MRSYLRTNLKKILGKFSKRLISKHHAEVILISGWTGTSISRELVYHFLKDKYNVRRNVKKVWWDLSIPLIILGYEDKKRNFLEWVVLIIRAFFSITFKPSYPHKIIIDLDTSLEEIASFWLDFVNPNIVLLLREKPESKIVEVFLNRKGSEKIIYSFNPKQVEHTDTELLRSFTYGTRNVDLTYKKNKNILELSYRSKEANVSIPKQWIFMWEIIPASISVGILQGLSLEYLANTLPTFTPHPTELRNYMFKIKEFVNEKD